MVEEKIKGLDDIQSSDLLGLVNVLKEQSESIVKISTMLLNLENRFNDLQRRTLELLNVQQRIKEKLEMDKK